MWWKLRCEVEASLVFHEPLAGASVDLSKAFNTLPRVPVYALALHAGIPPGVVKAWSGAVAACTRRFRVNDDWKATGREPSQVVSALQAVDRFAGIWDLAVDPAKSAAWASSPEARKQLRASGLSVVLASRDLGGQASSTRGRSNAVITSRIASLDAVWPRLASSPSPYRAKVSALSTAVWPRALYGCSTAQLAKSHFQRLRTGALRGLQAQKPGANPLIHLSLVEYPVADPAFFALRQCFHDLIRHGSREGMAPVAQELLSGATVV